jgi:hypothetical protein
MGTLHEHLCNFMTTAQWILITMRNNADKFCREDQKTHFMFNKYFWPAFEDGTDRVFRNVGY